MARLADALANLGFANVDTSFSFGFSLNKTFAW